MPNLHNNLHSSLSQHTTKNLDTKNDFIRANPDYNKVLNKHIMPDGVPSTSHKRKRSNDLNIKKQAYLTF